MTFTNPDEIKRLLMAKKPELQMRKADMLSTGSTLLNLAITGNPEAGFSKGEYVFLVGDSMSGKTWFSLTCLAEAARRKSFKDHAFIFDDVERGANMDKDFYFGSRVNRRLKPPPFGISTTVEEFYFNINEAIDNGPCIYVLDSMDALSCEADIKQYEAEKKAFEQGKEVSGSYGTGKSKANSNGLRLLVGRLEESESILIIISQTRDNIGFGSQFNPKTRSGGKALRFYATTEVWTSVKGQLKKKVKGKDRQQGAITTCKIEKNRWTGQKHKVDVPFYHSMGIDDVGSCIDYLLDENHWKKTKATISAPDFEFSGTREKLIEHIESEELEGVLREIVGEVWAEIQEATNVQGRKRRYE